MQKEIDSAIVIYTYKLMVKTHNVTGLKYLCITKREDWEKYTGSGVHWNRHLKKHGYNFRTEVIFSTEDPFELGQKGIFFSEKFDVVKSKEWANMVPEKGYDTEHGMCNLGWFIKNSDPEVLEEMYARRSISIKENNIFNIGTAEEQEITRLRMSLSACDLWNSRTYEEKLSYLREMFKARDMFFEKARTKGTPEQIKYSKNLSEAQILRFENFTEEERKEYGQKISEGRLNMSDEAKAIRVVRVIESYSKSLKRQKAMKELGQARKGENNPSAKGVTINGIFYHTIIEACKKLKVGPITIRDKMKEQKSDSIILIKTHRHRKQKGNPLTINGIEYISMEDACRETDFSRRKIQNAVDKQNSRNVIIES